MNPPHGVEKIFRNSGTTPLPETDMKYAIGLDHPAVTRLLVAHPREFVEALSAPSNGAYGIEYGRITAGGEIHDVLAAILPDEYDRARTMLLLIQPTTGVLSIAMTIHPVSYNDHTEYACVSHVTSPNELKQFEGDDASDPVRAIRRDMMPQGDTTTIGGTLEHLAALARRADDRALDSAVRHAAATIMDALYGQLHQEARETLRAGPPGGRPDHVGASALKEGIRTAARLRHTTPSRMRMHDEYDHDGHEQANAASAFLDRLRASPRVSVDGGDPVDASDVLTAYGTKDTPYATLLVGGRVVDGEPFFVGDMCVLDVGGTGVTLRAV